MNREYSAQAHKWGFADCTTTWPRFAAAAFGAVISFFKDRWGSSG